MRMDILLLLIIPVIVIPICGWVYWLYVTRGGKEQWK